MAPLSKILQTDLYQNTAKANYKSRNEEGRAENWKQHD
jgi:hypothetical protein